MRFTNSDILDEEFLVEQTPPHHDRLAGELGIDLVGDPSHRQAAVETNRSPFGLAGEGAEALPPAHRTDAIAGQVGKPIVGARMGLAAMVARVVAVDEALQPAVRLGFALGLIEVAERLVTVGARSALVRAATPGTPAPRPWRR